MAIGNKIAVLFLLLILGGMCLLFSACGPGELPAPTLISAATATSLPLLSATDQIVATPTTTAMPPTLTFTFLPSPTMTIPPTPAPVVQPVETAATVQSISQYQCIDIEEKPTNAAIQGVLALSNQQSR